MLDLALQFVAAAPADTDKQLIARVGQGDLTAFEDLVRRHQKGALRAARRLLGDAHEAEDLAQEAFLQVFRHAQRYKPEAASFKTWFYTILTNLCRNAVKKKKPLYFDEPPFDIAANDNPASTLMRSEQQQRLARAILKLPLKQRLAFILCHYEEFSYAEAARSLDLTVKAIESLLVREADAARGIVRGRKISSGAQGFTSSVVYSRRMTMQSATKRSSITKGNS